MGFVLAAILTTVVIGLPVTLAIDRGQRGAGLVGLSYLYGAGVVWAALLAMSLVGMRWTAASATIVLVVMATATWVAVLLRARSGPPASLPAGVAASLPPHSPARYLARAGWKAALPLVVDLATAFSIVTYSIYATVARVWSWDFWAIWGLKGRVFLENGGIDWRFLRSPFNDFAHPDYPLLVPLNYAWAGLVSGGWDDRWMALSWMAFTIAVVLVIRSLAAEEVSPPAAALIGFAAAGVAFTRHVGLADAALVAYGAAAILMLRRHVVFDDAAALRHGVILLGLAASTKNEGVALVATVVIAMLIHRWRRTSSLGLAVREMARLWPAVAIAIPWLVIRAVVHLQTDIARGSFAARVLERLAGIVPITAGLLRFLPDPWIWLFILVGAVLMTREARSAERFVLSAVAIQMFWYVAAYFGTPLDVAWHIETSWPRIGRHVQLPLVFVVMIALAQALPRGETQAHAEARSDLH